MLALTRRFRTTLFFTALASVLVLADSSAHDARRLEQGRRHHGVSILPRDNHLGKRFDKTRFTYFEVGENACGSFDHDSDFIVALNTEQWDGGSHCYEKITISYNGKSTQAQITDECMGCPPTAIDLSPGLFEFLVPQGLGQGEVYGSWDFGGDAAPTTTSKPPPPPPTTTHTTHTTTSSPPPPPPTTHHTTTTHSTTHTTSSSSTPTTTSTSTSTSATPTATVTTFDTGNLNQFNLAVVQLINLSNAILASPNSA